MNVVIDLSLEYTFLGSKKNDYKVLTKSLSLQLKNKMKKICFS